MARQEIPIVVLGADGRPYAGASVAVRTDPGGADATIYQAKTGGATHPNPRISDAQGRVEGWLERGDYAATISSVAGLGPWVESFPIASAIDVHPVIVDTYANRPGGLNGQAGTAPPDGVRFLASDKRMEWVCWAGVWTLVHAYAPDVVALPGSPIDGQECVFIASATGGVKWHLRYRAASANASKWEVIGGEALVDESLAVQSTALTTYTDLATVGPQVTLPLAGDYDIEHSCGLGNNTAGQTSLATVKLGAAAASDNDRIQANIPTANQATTAASGPLRRTGLAAAAVVKQQYLVTGGTGSFSYRRLSVRPVRLG